MKKKFLSLLTSFMLTFSLLGAVPAATISAAESNETAAVAQISEDEFIGNVYSDAELGSVELLDEETAAKVPTYDSATSDINTASNSFITKTGTTYGYEFLAKESNGAKRQQFYNDVYDMCVKFWDQTIDHSDQTYTNSQGYKFYVIQKINFKKYDLTLQEAISTYSVVKHDNPSFYFLPTTVAYSGSWYNYTDLALLVPYESEYSSKSSRKSIQDSIIAFASEMSNMVDLNDTYYQIALTFNNYLRDNIGYAMTNGSPSQEHYAHNIVGVINYKKGVCESFAKTYQLLLNYVGVDNIYVIGKGNGSGHAWSMVKFDNGKYYYVDTTWNQNTKSNRFFAKGTKAFVETAPTHVAYTPKTPNLDYLYDLPAVPSDDYNESKMNIANCSVGLERDSYIYTGSEIMPDITIMNDDVILEKDKHYTVTYVDNINVGTATAIITGMGYYTDVVLKTFDITAASFSIIDPEITLSADSFEYTGSALEPKISVKVGDKILVENTDYVPTYVNNIEPGTAIVIVIGIGNYTGAAKTTFTIKEKHVHSFGKWKQTVAPTCTKKGSESRKCTVCGKIETRDINRVDHNWSEWKTLSYNFKKNTSTQTRICAVCNKIEKQTVKNAITRLAGANRYDSAAVISKEMYKTSDTVIIATGMTFNDALVAVPLASAYNVPLLLATEKHITAQTEAELKRLGAKNVIVVSTNGAIGAKAKAEFKAAKYNMTYIEGKTCFETAAKVAKALQTKTKKAPDTIFFATDSAFADALSASPVAAIKGAPIMYLKNTGSIDKATADYLKSVKGKVKNAYIIGGDGVISNAMMKNVANALGLTVNKTVQRVAGKNRYETCTAVNNKFKSVLTGDGICVAKGLDFPDALAGGVYAASTKQALFLADGKKLQDCQNTYLKGKSAGKLTVFGGTGAVPDSLVKLIAKASV